LLTTKDISAADVRAKLLEAGFANLWVPKMIFKVNAIPVLGSGKTDLKACRTLAIELAAAQAAGAQS
jgi:acyl-[acyl-carrier-protein]-phospholipid O-acyltransferase/long-chain-fatty-acid--[acyl-carrier-protein] ligase